MELWGSEISKNPPVVRYEDVMASDKGVAEWTLKIVLLGPVFQTRFANSESAEIWLLLCQWLPPFSEGDPKSTGANFIHPPHPLWLGFRNHSYFP